MKKLKGVRKLEKTVTSILAELYDDLNTAKLGIDFEAKYWNNNIVFSLFITERSDNAMREAISKLFHFHIPANGMFFFSCLHELGHCATMGAFDIEEIPYLFEIQNYGMTTRPTAEWEITYYSLPHEYIANRWAVEKCREIGVDAFNEYVEELEKALGKFYKKNRVS